MHTHHVKLFAACVASMLLAAASLTGCGGGSNARMDDMPGGVGIDTGTQQPGTGPERPPTNADRAHDWLFAGTVANQQARDQGIAAIREILSVSADEFSFGSYFGPNVIRGATVSGPGFIGELPPVIGESAPYVWGYWNHADFALTTKLFQRTHYIPGDAFSPDVTGKLVVAVMDHGYFGVGHTLLDYADSRTSTGFGTSGFYAVDASLNLGGGRDLASLDLTGSIWTGEAFAIERHSQAGTGHVGIVELIVTDEINVGYVGPEYSVALNINLENGQHFSMTGTAGGAHDFGNPSDIFVASGGQTDTDGISEYHARGQFAGPNAEQAFGAFEVPDYHGSFGLTRYSGN